MAIGAAKRLMNVMILSKLFSSCTLRSDFTNEKGIRGTMEPALTTFNFRVKKRKLLKKILSENDTPTFAQNMLKV